MTELNEKCKNCEHLKKGVFYICGSQCGIPANGGHPLSPCVLWECDYDDETGEEITPECYEDEVAIMEGHRCASYCRWLSLMHREEARTHYCEECALSHMTVIAEHQLFWSQGSKYLCDNCFRALTGKR